MKQHDNSEAMRLAVLMEAMDYGDTRKAAALLRQQSERIAELEAERDRLLATVKDDTTMIFDLCAERDRLREQVERLRVDGERMDWVEACPATQLPKDAEVMRRWLWHRPAGAGNLRAAIDAARTTHKDQA